MEILSEIKGLYDNVTSKTENIEHFRYYRYCRRLFEADGLFGISDHFFPSVQEKLQQLKSFGFHQPIHLPQFKLQEILYQQLPEKTKEQIFFGHKAIDINHSEKEVCFFLFGLLKNFR